MRHAARSALDSMPRARLAFLPTRLHDAARLRRALGGEDRCPRILLKRDDLTDLALGGNKARKLEFLLGDALRQDATALVTTGGVQSNHARMTAAAGRMLGLRVVLVLTPNHATPLEPQGNLLLDRILGAEVRLAAPEREQEKVQAALEELQAEGERPYLVALGGSCRLGALGYVDAARELVEQLEAAGAAPSRLYHASGSRGTQAGLELGARLFQASFRVHGVAVSPGEAEKAERAASIVNEAAELLGADVRVTAAELLTHQEYYGGGYAVPTEEGAAAIMLLARTEGVFLDPVYTAKAMAGMLDHIWRGEIAANETVVFLHTGGVPGLFAQAGSIMESVEREPPAGRPMPREVV